MKVGRFSDIGFVFFRLAILVVYCYIRGE